MDFDRGLARSGRLDDPSEKYTRDSVCDGAPMLAITPDKSARICIFPVGLRRLEETNVQLRLAYQRTLGECFRQLARINLEIL
jgi:hypothetical protein